MTDTSHTELVAYRPAWREQFAAERERIAEVFGDDALAIEHIGSTSIEGLPSKPIIDIGVMIARRDDAELYNEPLSAIGYQSRLAGNERHFFTKGEPTAFHLSIAYADQGGFWWRQVLFRDWLREHPADRDRYARIKQELITQDPAGSETYITGKTDFVYEILHKAGWRGNCTYYEQPVV